MCIQRPLSVAHFIATLAACGALVPLGCGSSDVDDDGASGGSAGAGSEAGHSSVAGAGGDGQGASAGDTGSSGDCPLDDTARERAEAIIMQSLAEAAWITNQTHGAGMFASRGFGFAIPLTTVASIMALTLSEECTEPRAFEEYCPPAEPGLEGPTTCSRLECVAAGELAISLWYEPLPFTTPEDPEPGEVEVTQAEQVVNYVEQDDGSVAIQWTTSLELTPSDSEAITIVESGNSVAEVEGSENHAAAMITITGLATGADLVVEFESSAADASGAGTIDGQQVFEVTHDNGIVWSEACSAP